MTRRYLDGISRRRFLSWLTWAGGMSLVGARPGLAAVEPPPETRTIRIVHNVDFPTICYGPQYVAEALLRAEGFTTIEYVPWPIANDATAIASGKADIGAAWAGDFVKVADTDDSIVVLSGMHTGCAEVFGGRDVRAFRDLRGRRVVIGAENDIAHTFFSLIVAYIGLDPKRDIEWVEMPYEQWGRALDDGEVDAMILWPPEVQTFRKKNVGHTIWNMADRPWSQYFCCMVTANRDFVGHNPVATKRALRAILKATDSCAIDPERAARSIVDSKLPVSYELALEVFREIPYGQWRQYDPVDTLRFYAVRLHQVGMIQQAPDSLIEKCSEWRFLDELKKELKV